MRSPAFDWSLTDRVLNTPIGRFLQLGEISIPGVQEDKVDGDLASIPYPVATSAIYSSVALMSYLDGLLREEDFHEISTFGAVPVPADRFPMECSKMPIQATLKYLFRTKNLEIDSKEMMEEFKFHELHDQACRKALDTILKRVPTTCLGSLGWIFPACNNMMLTMPDSMARWESCGAVCTVPAEASPSTHASWKETDTW